MRPDFLTSLDDETRAFLHIAGIVFRENIYGALVAYLRVREFDWVLYLPHGDMCSLEYWKEVALRGHREANALPSSAQR